METPDIIQSLFTFRWVTYRWKRFL